MVSQKDQISRSNRTASIRARSPEGEGFTQGHSVTVQSWTKSLILGTCISETIQPPNQKHCVSWSALCFGLDSPSALFIGTFNYMLAYSEQHHSLCDCSPASQEIIPTLKMGFRLFPTRPSIMLHVHLWVTNITRLSMGFRLHGMVSIFLNV